MLSLVYSGACFRKRVYSEFDLGLKNSELSISEFVVLENMSRVGLTNSGLKLPQVTLVHGDPKSLINECRLHDSLWQQVKKNHDRHTSPHWRWKISLDLTAYTGNVHFFKKKSNTAANERGHVAENDWLSPWDKKKKDMFGLGCSPHSTSLFYVCQSHRSSPAGTKWNWQKTKMKYKSIV